MLYLQGRRHGYRRRFLDCGERRKLHVSSNLISVSAAAIRLELLLGGSPAGSKCTTTTITTTTNGFKYTTSTNNTKTVIPYFRV